MHKKAFLIFSIIIVALIGLTLIDYTPTKEVACTMDALQCPDGTFVGRVPPSCAFSPC